MNPTITAPSLLELSHSRWAPRVRLSLPATVEGSRGRVPCTCTSASLGGAFLEGVQLPMNSLTKVVFELGPSLGTLKLDAQVRHHLDAPRGMGVQFLGLEEDQIAVLDRLVSALAPDA